MSGRALIVSGLSVLVLAGGCQPKAKPIERPEFEPMVLHHLQTSRALGNYMVREQILVRIGGEENFESSVATSARYAEQGVTPEEINSLKIEAGFVAQRYFDKLAQDIESAPTWPEGDTEVWRERARLALASARRDFSYQYATNGDLGGVIHSTDRIRAWMKGEAKPVLGPTSDWALPQMVAHASTTRPDQPRRPGSSATLNPPTALAFPTPASR